MKLRRFALFTLVSIAAGLAAALLAVVLLGGPGPAPTPGSSLASRLGFQPTGPVSYADAVAEAAPAVVNIYSTKITGAQVRPSFQRFSGRAGDHPLRRSETSLGSGVIIGSDGFILTNHHVVKGADQIRVVLSDGRTLEARIAGSDPDTDLAVIQTGAHDLPVITVGDSRGLRVGDVVLAIGNPYGVGQSVTMGIVGATGRDRLGINTFEDFIQTDAAINPGNSGGALINARGELIGINTAIFSRTGGSDGIGFAIPIALARGVMEQILSQGRVVRGWLGIAGQQITHQLAEAFGLRDLHGVLVSAVLDGGPADRAGVRPGDVIERVGNRAPATPQGLLDIISSLAPGTEVEIRCWRGGRPLQLKAVISERPRIRRE